MATNCHDFGKQEIMNTLDTHHRAGPRSVMVETESRPSSSSITNNINIIILRTTPTTWWRQPWQLSARNCGTSNYTTTLCTHARAAATPHEWAKWVGYWRRPTTARSWEVAQEEVEVESKWVICDRGYNNNNNINYKSPRKFNCPC